MKVLVSAASRHGTATEIAATIAAELEAGGLTVDLVAPDDVAGLETYDAVVLGSGVYMGQWLTPAKRFAERFGEELRSRQLWLFSTGPLGTPPQPVGDPIDAEKLIERLSPVEHRVFAGRLRRDGLGLGERAIVRMVKAPYGDFRDWDAIAAWARQVAGVLRAEVTVPAS